MLPVLPLSSLVSTLNTLFSLVKGPEKSRLGSRDTLLTEIIPENIPTIRTAYRFYFTHFTYGPMNVLVAELFSQKASPPQEVDNLRLLGVKLRGGGTCLEVVRQPGHAAPRVTRHIIIVVVIIIITWTRVSASAGGRRL